MSPMRRWLILLLVAATSVATGQQPKSQAQAGVSGVFVGRSGKPLARFRLVIGQVEGDQDVLYSRIKLPTKLPATVTDDNGRFQFKSLPPGTYTIVYQRDSGALLPTEINIRAFVAVTRSIAPMLVGFELGTSEPFAERVWGREFTLLKGHTFYSEGANMKIWNATARRGLHGPYMEIRKGVIWQQRMEDKTQIKFEAWSF